MFGTGLGPWRSRFICCLNMHFHVKNIYPFPLIIGQSIGDCFYNGENAPNFLVCLGLPNFNEMYLFGAHSLS
jgi:hypothetical protein